MYSRTGIAWIWPMAYVIAEPCIGVKDSACVDACPVDCIHPKKNTKYNDGRPGFEEVPQLLHRPRRLHRLRRLRAGLPCLGDLRPRRPTREVEALRGTQRKLRRRRQVQERGVRQTPGREVDITKTQAMNEPSKAHYLSLATRLLHCPRFFGLDLEKNLSLRSRWKFFLDIPFYRNSLSLPKAA